MFKILDVSIDYDQLKNHTHANSLHMIARQNPDGKLTFPLLASNLYISFPFTNK